MSSPIYFPNGPKKVCSSCKVSKPLSEFVKMAKTKDGLHCWCKGCQKAYRTEYNAKNGDKNRAYALAYRHEHIERYHEYDKQRAKDLGPEYGRDKARARHFRKHNALVDKHVTRQWLRNRDGDSCHYCGITMSFDVANRYESNYVHVEHKVPLVRGGLHTEDNCVLACLGCNLAKGTKTDDEFRGMVLNV